MSRKVFISVLGTGYYEPAKYYFDNDKKDYIENRFVQVATFSHFCKDWCNDDVIYLFLTEGAKKINWAENAQSKHKKESYPGLSVELQKIEEVQRIIQTVDISDGNSEEEIWEIFNTVFSKLENGDKVYFDITHAFRSIPMLLMVLINYSKFLKEIEVKSITYGNWEAGKLDNGFAPVVDITSFSVLQDWSGAAQEFMKFGRLSMTEEVLTKPLKNLSKKYKGSNDELNNLRKLLSTLQNTPENIYTTRGKNIYSANEVNSFREAMNANVGNFFPPLQPLLKKLDEKIEGFKPDNAIMNGFEGVKWCIHYDWIQQGFTLLLETIISYLLMKMNENWEDEELRNIVNGCSGILKMKKPEEKWTGDAARNPGKTRLYLKKEIVSDFCEISYSLGGIRNDMNHAGMRSNPASVKRLKTSLPKLYEETMLLVKKWEEKNQL
ncbi:MAG: TIGR02221 family CRISPR-associated protein [Bacteroidota bacterium]